MSRTQIAFSHAGRIWVSNRDGSNLSRLTSGGHERKPLFSPDGSRIAFIGDYRTGYLNGNGAVYVMAATGGEARRLTFHPADIDVVGWTPDGTRILFSSRRAAFNHGVVQLFAVPAEGGFATRIPLAMAAEASLAADGGRIAYVPIRPWQEGWKRYRGGQTRSISIADLSDSRVLATVPRDNSSDFNPIWIGDLIYFLSDRNGPVTLYSYNLKSRQVAQIVRNGGLDIESASACVDAIVYEQFGSLHLIDLRSGSERTLDLRPVIDLAETRPRLEHVGPEQIRFAGLSPSGARAVFGARSEVLTAPAEKGDIRNITRTTDVVERDPAWSPDGTAIAYLSDESGEYALHIRDQSGRGETRKITLGKPPSHYYAPTWAPDSKKIGYTDKRLNFWYVDLKSGASALVDSDLYVDPQHRLQMTWSADSRWIAYSKQLRSHLHAVFVYSVERARSYQITDGMSDALFPVFDRDGRYLYFTASTDSALSNAWLDMSRMRRSVTRNVYLAVLESDQPSPLAPQSDEEESRATGTDDKHGKSGGDQVEYREPAAVRIEFAGIARRILPLPIPARNYQGLFAGKSGSLFLLEGPPVDSPDSSGESGGRVYRFDLKNRSTEQILDSVADSFHLSSSGDAMLYAREGQWFISSTATGTVAAARRLELGNMVIHVDPRAEWNHMFRQVWRNERDFFYDPRLHGLDLEATRKKYQPYLESIGSRDDLNYLFAEMLGNVTVGHMLAFGGDLCEAQPTRIGLLGADFSVENGRYRFARIYDGDTWNPGLRVPLAQPGATVEAGEYLLAVDGRDVLARVDVYSFFERTAGKQVVLRVGPRPDGDGARDVTVVPVEDEAGLREFAWIEDNRRKVDELTHGRVAYVYLPDTGPGGYASFNRYYFAQVGKDAAIIDERFNQGGASADHVIDHLQRPLLSYHHMREGQDITGPQEAIFGPKVMIINEMAGSGGDMLAWMFRQAGIGPLVGKRTWGGVVGHYQLAKDLLDGGIVSTPNLALYKPGGSWEVENYGVPPDIEVEYDPAAVRAGRDPQLEKAVAVVMQLLEKNPPPGEPRHPPYPDYHGNIGK